MARPLDEIHYTSNLLLAWLVGGTGAVAWLYGDNRARLGETHGGAVKFAGVGWGVTLGFAIGWLLKGPESGPLLLTVLVADRGLGAVVAQLAFRQLGARRRRHPPAPAQDAVNVAWPSAALTAVAAVAGWMLR
ncbi:MAG: hypothetical protein AAF628_29820 [Planctomycetota bacterium]